MSEFPSSEWPTMGTLASFTRYQRLVSAPASWPAATIAPDLDDAAELPDSWDLPGVRVLSAAAAGWPAATIAPDLD